MPSWKKFAAVDDLNETIKTLATLGIRQRHPGATPEQVRRLLADQMLGEELARKVYDYPHDKQEQAMLTYWSKPN